MVETDYSSWAVFVQCEEEGAGNKFLSTRFVVVMMKMIMTTTNTTIMMKLIMTSFVVSMLIMFLLARKFNGEK